MTDYPVQTVNAPANAPTAARFSIPSIIAGLCLIGCFFVGGWLGLLLGIVAIICGLIGMVVALSPSVRGGILSILGVVGGAIIIIISILRIFFGLLS